MLLEHTSFPQQLVVELTAGCNQACIFCGRASMVRPKKTMSPELFKQIVDEVARESPSTELWPTFMGEAMLLGTKLFDLIRYAKDAGLQKVTLNTNGTRLTDENIQALLDSGLDRFIISCDAHTPKTHAIVRPPVTPSATYGLEGIYAGIHNLLNKIKEQGRDDLLVELQFSMFDENQHEVDDFINYWLEQGVVVKVRPKVYWSGNVDGGEERVTLTNRKPCMWVMDSAAIQFNGNVVMCPVDCDGKYVAGNIQIQPLKEIWGGALRWMRELHLQERFSELPEVCRSCPDWEVKKAHPYYPNAELEAQYTKFLNLGRTYSNLHLWENAPKVTAEG